MRRLLLLFTTSKKHFVVVTIPIVILLVLLIITELLATTTTVAFVIDRKPSTGIIIPRTGTCSSTSLFATTKGFGVSSSSSSSSNNRNNKKKKSNNKLLDSLNDDNDETKKKDKKTNQQKPSTGTTYIKSEQEAMLAKLATEASKTCIGKVVTEAQVLGLEVDPFWELMPSLITSRFPKVKDDQLHRIAGFIRHTINPKSIEYETDLINNDYRPTSELHAYMPGLGPTQPFYDPKILPICNLLSSNYLIIRQEYEALVDYFTNNISANKKYGFQSVTTLNYESGWKTLVLFYNGHRITGFPYHLCPTTTKILETVPIAGRIAGFNRQSPLTGIPKHTDGNNMWLTCQLGLYIPDQQKAYIRVADQIERWNNGTCLVYDTTFEHETFNEHPTQDRIVLHVDFFNTLSLSRTEIDIMQYIYTLREQFMKAEGISKVNSQRL